MDVIICPITQEPIVKIGIICTGDIFEYSAIKQWFQYSDINPLTGLTLPSTTVIEWNMSLDKEALDNCTTNLKNEHKLWNFTAVMNLSYLKPIYNYKLSIYENYDFTSYEWTLYNRIFVNCYISNTEMTIPRPDGSGNGDYDFLDLSGLWINQNNEKHRHYTLVNFKNTCFTGCFFGRTKFIGCNLDGDEFLNCEFKGEEVCFYNVTGTFIFNNCAIEHTKSWQMNIEVNDFIRILKYRGLGSSEFEIDGANIIVTAK